MKEEKGITLVALVVTVVVLIILAGIGIGALVNPNGVVDKTKEAKIETEKKDIEEQINIMTIQSMDRYGNVIKETLKTKLEDLPDGKEIIDGVYYIGVIYPEYEFYIEVSSGKISETKPLVIADEVPMPEGYIASQVWGENKIEDGLVIYEGTDPVTEENHEEALTSRNQYIWIPVNNIDSMVMCSSNSSTSQCNLVLEGNTLKCTKHLETATDLVGRLYVSSNVDTGNSIYSYKMNFTDRKQTYNKNNYYEPGVLSSDPNNNLDIEQLKSDFILMATSVAKNKGFYISRYEVGENGDSKKNQKILTSANTNGDNYLGANMWYGLYNTLRNINNNQQMIWGCQYDQVIKFIGEEAQVGHSDRNLMISPALSGQNELDKMKNIYDLEGNFWESTLEAAGPAVSGEREGRGHRGNDYAYVTDGDMNPASFRVNNLPTLASYYNSTRSIIYL